MDKFLINGPCKIKGKVSISGSKNASLPILAATLLFDKPVIIKNLPRVRDIDTMLNLLKSLGSKIILSKDKKTAKIINKKKLKTFCSYSLVKTMRGSILVLGPLISKLNQAKISLPGGCAIGSRPINYHLAALKKLGMTYTIKNGYILARSKRKLKGNIIKFPKVSVGATINTILAASLGNGTTIIKGTAAREPEILDLTKFLNKAGANIKWSGRTCTIVGVNSLAPTTYTVMSDRIEAGTFSVAATLAKGSLEIKNFNPKVIKTELELLKRAGAKINQKNNKILIKGPEKIKPIKNVKTKEWPGVATDMQSQLMVLMCRANGKSTITENIFENRFLHVAELQRLGANIQIKKNKAIIEGNTKFIGAELMSSDLRASVALVLAAMISEGKSIINRIYHLDRGYENLERKLRNIGVKIRRVK